MTGALVHDAETGRRVDVVAERASREFLDQVPRDFARAHLVLSQGRDDRGEHLVVAASTDGLAVHNIGVLLGIDIHCEIADEEEIARAIDQVYGLEQPDAATGEGELAAPDDADIERLLQAADRDLLSTDGKGPVIKLVDMLLFEALGHGASDIHLQPLADRTLVRYRLDGVLHTSRELPRTATSAVISRVKVMGRMDIAEKRVPQDGRASVTIGAGANGRSVDLRISTIPTTHGERAVIRLLDNSSRLCDFGQLGMPADVAERYLAHAQAPSGIILLTGPTGSGKTTTLYATLQQIGSPGVNIMTIEDPVEYELSSSGAGAGVGIAISQSQVNARKGVTFASGLRHILRQDPDVIMVGEIRDLETARVAIQASLTGHMVLSTLHTNDAVGAVARLIDLGIEPYLVGSALSAAVAQRLVRLTHQACAGAGCDSCFGTGFAGRRGLFCLFSVTESIRELITGGAPVSAIRGEAIKGGMRTLADEGRHLIDAGLVNPIEVRRLVQDAVT